MLNKGGENRKEQYMEKRCSMKITYRDDIELLIKEE